MLFKKLIEPLKEILEKKAFKQPLPLQKLVLPKIKGGVSLFCIAPKGKGKLRVLF
jgi:Lhr-like helicase